MKYTVASSSSARRIVNEAAARRLSAAYGSQLESGGVAGHHRQWRGVSYRNDAASFFKRSRIARYGGIKQHQGAPLGP